jgi:hypothetical protein
LTLLPPEAQALEPQTLE